MQSLGEQLSSSPAFSKLIGKPLSDEELAQGLEEIERREQEKTRVAYLKTLRGVFDRDSLWGTGGKREFSFEYWLPERQQDTKRAKELKRKSKLVTNRLRSEAFNVLVVGKAGTGKTAMVLAMLNALENHSDRTVMFVSSIELRKLVMHDFSDKQAASKLERVSRSMREVDVLVIDDFGSEAGGMTNEGRANERLQQFYFEIADARFVTDKHGKRLKSNIITTNNSASELGDMYNEKLVSRLITKKQDNQLNFAGMGDVRE